MKGVRWLSAFAKAVVVVEEITAYWQRGDLKGLHTSLNFNSVLLHRKLTGQDRLKR